MRSHPGHDPAAARAGGRIVGTRVEMEPRELSPSRTSAIRQFAWAVLELLDEPGPENVERYLAASRALEDSAGRGLLAQGQDDGKGRARARRARQAHRPSDRLDTVPQPEQA